MTATYLCFAPDDATAKNAIRLLRHYRIDDHLIGLIADVDLALDAVSSDEECQTWEALDVLQRSVAKGGAPGIFDGLHAVSLPSVATTLAGSAIFAADVADIGIAAVLSRVLGKPLDSDTIAGLCRRLADGELLLAVRLTNLHATQIGQQLRRQVPLLRCEGNLLAPEQEVQRA
jgi:hypothetical protein